MEKILFGLSVAALGLITVFAGLLILIIFIKILSSFTAGKGKKKTKTNANAVKSNANDQVPADVMAAITAALAAYDDTPSPEVVTAIAAALNVVMGEGKFIVRHVKRISNAPRWNRAGREEQIYSRF